MPANKFNKDLQFYKFCSYGFLKNLRFFEPFLMLFFIEKGLSFLEIGILYSIREIGVNLIEIPTGIIADIFGRRKTMVFSFACYIIAFLVFNFSTSFTVFIFAMICFSFGEAFRTGTHKAMIFEYLRIKGWTDQKVHYYGHTRSASQIGSAVSAVIAALIVYYTGTLKVVFLYSTIPYFLDLFLMMSYPKALDGDLKGFSPAEIVESIRGVFVSFFKALKNPVFVKTIVNISVPQGFHKAVKDYLQPAITMFALSIPLFMYLEDQKRVSIMIGLFYTVIYLLTSVASKNSGNIAERFRHLCLPLNITLFAVFIVGAVVGVFMKTGLPIVAIAGFLVIYVIENIRRPIGVSYLSSMVDPQIVATVLSIDSQFSAFAASVIALVLGYIADKAGIGTAIIIISFVMGIFSIFALLPGEKCKLENLEEELNG
ncbi:MAG: MFS transporter [Spirochaetia bacterium]|jgi:MFS family permease|nr:MFS transporter [Spirochaetia bacterium]